MTAAVKISLSTEHDFDALEATAAEGSADGSFRFEGHRSFSPGLPAPFSQQRHLVEDLQEGRLSIYSFKPGRWAEVDRIVEDSRVFCESIPLEANMNLIVHHEPKDNASDLGGGSTIAGTSAEYVTMQREVSNMIRNDINPVRAKAGGRRIRLWGCLEADAVRAGYADKFWPGDDVWHGLSWDGYCWDRYYPTIFSMETVMAKCYAYTVAKGLPFGISETSIGHLYAPHRADWVREGIEWAQRETTNIRFLTFWSSTEQFTLSDRALRAIGDSAV